VKEEVSNFLQADRELFWMGGWLSASLLRNAFIVSISRSCIDNLERL